MTIPRWPVLVALIITLVVVVYFSPPMHLRRLRRAAYSCMASSSSTLALDFCLRGKGYNDFGRMALYDDELQRQFHAWKTNLR